MEPALLIVDDEPNLRRLLVRLLEREGYVTYAVGNGAAALEICEADGAQLVAAIVDVRLPPHGGGEVVEHLIDRQPGLGIVLVSGDHLPRGLSARLEEWGGAFLRKPFAPTALIDTVRQVARAIP